MSITVTISEDEILSLSNDFSLGERVRQLYWEEKRKSYNYQLDEEKFLMEVNPDGSVVRIIKPWVCGICGKPTDNLDYDYLVGYDHLACHLQGDAKMDEKDKCVICGQETPYTRSTNIYNRIGYVEGGGQGCYQPHICDK